VIVDDFSALLHALISSPRVQSLWSIKDRGMPVFAHSMDVALICLEKYPEARERFPGFRLDVVLIGAVLHDLTKLSAREGNGPSHSQIMTHQPSIAVDEAIAVLDAAQTAAGAWLDEEGIDHVWHVVAAHHGPWGKVKPVTPEAQLLFHADNYSATHHRIAPVDANDILPLLNRGYRWSQVGTLLDVGRAVIKSRLQDACRAEDLRGPSELLTRWLDRGAVLTGDTRQIGQIARARFLVEFAHRCPAALVREVRPLLTCEECSAQRREMVDARESFSSSPHPRSLATSPPAR